MGTSRKKRIAHRSKINLDAPREVKYWRRELDVDERKLRELIDKVGNSAAAVRKELEYLDAPR